MGGRGGEEGKGCGRGGWGGEGTEVSGRGVTLGQCPSVARAVAGLGGVQPSGAPAVPGLEVTEALPRQRGGKAGLSQGVELS